MTRHRPLTIGTLSFARCGPKMVLKPRERVRLILAAIDGYEPDLLVTAGYAVHSPRQLDKLARGISSLKRQTYTITEVHHETAGKRPRTEPHALWSIDPAGDAQRLGNQMFATSKEADARSAKRVAALQRVIADRVVRCRGFDVVVLGCGEINVVRGRETPRFLDQEIGAIVLAADVVVNPTHDRMSNAGTLRAKRRFLSQPTDERPLRAYVSCSNWEACGDERALQYPSPTLHTVYQAGQPLPYGEPADGAFGFVFRLWRLGDLGPE